MTKYGAKKDANHNEIVDALKKLGCDIVDISPVGFGVPDILIWCRDQWMLADIKNGKTTYGKKGLNKNQTKWATNWKGGPVYLLYTVQDAVELVQGNLSKIKSVGGAIQTRVPQKGNCSTQGHMTCAEYREYLLRERAGIK